MDRYNKHILCGGSQIIKYSFQMKNFGHIAQDISFFGHSIIRENFIFEFLVEIVLFFYYFLSQQKLRNISQQTIISLIASFRDTQKITRNRNYVP